MKEEKIKRIVRELVDLDSNQKEDVILMLSASKLLRTIADIQQDIFRPARKHGYADQKLNKLITDSGEDENGYNRGEEIVGELENKFIQILEDNEVTTLIF